MEFADKIYQDAITKFGWAAQADMLIEEMAELTQALLKHRRKPSEKTFDNLCEEFADVHIVLKQLLCEMDDKKLDEWYDIKLQRLRDLIDKK